MGGKLEIDMIYVLFYLADLKFVATYGRITFGHRYMAMRSGPVPYNVFRLLLDMNNNSEDNLAETIKKHVTVEDGIMSSGVRYDSGYLAQEEVTCLFEIINKYKDMPHAQLRELAKGVSWQGTQRQSFISITDMAKEGNASEYILMMIALKYESEKWSKL